MTFEHGQDVYRVELRDFQPNGVETQILQNGELLAACRFTEIAKGLTQQQRKKLNNFLQKMKALKVIRAGDVVGELRFNVRMVRLYIWLQHMMKQPPAHIGAPPPAT